MIIQVLLLVCISGLSQTTVYATEFLGDPLDQHNIQGDALEQQDATGKEGINDFHVGVKNFGPDDPSISEVRSGEEPFRRGSYSPRSPRTFSSDQIDAFNQGLHRKRPKFIGKRNSMSDCESTLNDQSNKFQIPREKSDEMNRCYLLLNEEELEKKSRKFVGKRGRKFVGKRGDVEDFQRRLLLLPISSSLSSSNNLDNEDELTNDDGLKLDVLGQSEEVKRGRMFVGKRGRMFVGKRGRMFVGKRPRQVDNDSASLNELVSDLVDTTRLNTDDNADTI